MTPVSYASPTYYSDRLCERGRLYIRKFFNGDDKGLWDDLNSFKNKLENDFRTAMNKQFGSEKHDKGKEEKALERNHAEKVAKKLKSTVALVFFSLLSLWLLLSRLIRHACSIS
jgi:eukaryotic translation initiation factor 2C